MLIVWYRGLIEGAGILMIFKVLFNCFFFKNVLSDHMLADSFLKLNFMIMIDSTIDHDFSIVKMNEND